MQNRINRLLCTYAALLSGLMLSCLLIQSFALALRLPGGCKVSYWALFLLVQLLTNETLIGFRAPLNLYLIFNGIALCASAALMYTFWCDPATGSGTSLCYAVCAAATSLHCAIASYTGHSARTLLRFGDVLILFLIGFCFAMSKEAPSATIPLLRAALFVLAADLLLSVRLRTLEAENSCIRANALSAFPALLPAALFALLLSFIASSLAPSYSQSAAYALVFVLSLLWKAISCLLTGFAMGIAYVLLFFMKWMPAGLAKAERATVFAQDPQISQDIPVLSPLPGYFFIALLILLLLSFIAAILFLFKGRRIQRKGTRFCTASAQKSSHAFETLLAFLKYIRENFTFFFLCLRHKNTPEGLYILAARLGGRAGLKKRSSESPGAYLRRLSGYTKETEAFEAADTLRLLADLLDRRLYSAAPPAPEMPQSRLYARHIREGLRQKKHLENPAISAKLK